MLLGLCGCNAAPQETAAPTETVNAGPDPKEDTVVNILMVGNSFCYYYVEELYGMAETLGYELYITNLYYGGASIKSHWTWLTDLSVGNGKCEYWITSQSAISCASTRVVMVGCL